MWKDSKVFAQPAIGQCVMGHRRSKYRFIGIWIVLNLVYNNEISYIRLSTIK